jgi:hypothetical protein
MKKLLPAMKKWEIEYIYFLYPYPELKLNANGETLRKYWKEIDWSSDQAQAFKAGWDCALELVEQK